MHLIRKSGIIAGWILGVLSMTTFAFAKEKNLLKESLLRNMFYDSNHVRYELYQTNGKKPYNWLFIPGGPGADSSYLQSLVDIVDLPGNVWMIDLPGNGSNYFEEVKNNWFSIFPSIIDKFENPIIVGHSFGGMFPLLFPELEEKLKGFIILNSAPSLWLEQAVSYSKQFNLPDLSEEMEEFTQNPSQETFEKALDACMPYYFPVSTLEKGRELLMQVPFQYDPAVWWQRKAVEMNYSALWIPHQVPTLIVGAKYDCICPFTIFENDERFIRDNITLCFIENGGHLPWLENPQKVKEAIENFSLNLDLEQKTDEPHTVMVILEAKPGKETLLKNSLAKVAELSRLEDGCLEYRFYQDKENSTRFGLYEKWQTKELHQKQFQKPYIIEFAKDMESLLNNSIDAIFAKEIK